MIFTKCITRIAQPQKPNSRLIAPQMSRRAQRTNNGAQSHPVADMTSAYLATQDFTTSESDTDDRVHEPRTKSYTMKKKKLVTAPVHPDGHQSSSHKHIVSQPSAVSSKFYQNLPLNGNQIRQHPPIVSSSNEFTLAQIGYDSTTIANWSGIQQPPKTDLFELLRRMILSFEKTNVQIRIGETTFNCHMLVLQCYSEFFMNLNTEHLVVLPADKVTPQAFHKVYDWMLSSQPIVQRDGILELFNAAQFLKIRGLVAQCWVCLDDDERFSEDAAFLLYLEARALGQDELIQRLMLNRVSKFFLTLVASKDFLDFDADELCRLLSSNSIGVNSETDVLMSAARWLDHCWPERQAHLQDVMQCVRFGLMAPWQLIEMKRNVDIKEIQRFVDSTQVQSMIDDALSYVTTKYWYANNENSVQHYLERLQFTEPLERQWISDPIWNEHFKSDNQMCVSYASFCEYLVTIRGCRDHWRTLQYTEVHPNAMEPEQLHQQQLLVSRLGGGQQPMPNGDNNDDAIGEVGRLLHNTL